MVHLVKCPTPSLKWIIMLHLLRGGNSPLVPKPWHTSKWFPYSSEHFWKTTAYLIKPIKMQSTLSNNCNSTNKINIPQNVTLLENPSCRTLPRVGAQTAVAKRNSGTLERKVYSVRNPPNGLGLNIKFHFLFGSHTLKRKQRYQKNFPFLMDRKWLLYLVFLWLVGKNECFLYVYLHLKFPLGSINFSVYLSIYWNLDVFIPTNVKKIVYLHWPFIIFDIPRLLPSIILFFN